MYYRGNSNNLRLYLLEALQLSHLGRQLQCAVPVAAASEIAARIFERGKSRLPKNPRIAI